jgi:cytochrome c peroxidase
LITDQTTVLQGAFQTLGSANKTPASPTTTCKDSFKASYPQQAFESRVLQGIWATAPYLHNGSIPTLSDLLKPVAERAATFKSGSGV